ncbi:MAG: hypothetical protein IKI45_09630, partial [Oscillospiraceae bacterium]|nr:hypothetical protein [Oscillospiraceae bacterium]
RTLGRGETRAQRGLPSPYGSSPRIRAPRPVKINIRTKDTEQGTEKVNSEKRKDKCISRQIIAFTLIWRLSSIRI